MSDGTTVLEEDCYPEDGRYVMVTWDMFIALAMQDGWSKEEIEHALDNWDEYQGKPIERKK